MIIRWALAALLASLCIGQARADDQLRTGSQPGWVVPIAETPVKSDGGAVTLRMLDLQFRFDDKGMHQFARQIIRVNSPEGLLAAGTLGLAWQPSLSIATVNRAVIHRGAETIDLLKDGKSFQILRREAGLESFTITGVLTAIMTVPDLRVGDEIELAYTIDAENPAIAGHAEALVDLGKIPAGDRVSLRFSWPTSRKVMWRGGTMLPKAVENDAAGWHNLTIARDDWQPPEVSSGAPGRYAAATRLQVADFSDWGAVADVMRPLFARAATLGPDSPVMAEVKRIAALSPDPRVRAAEALRVVQSQVRYLARVDGLGAYVPDPADTVWTAKTGDCKGKTVLLIAMLRALGITADPALVSATDGDGVDAALPMPGRFNHVIVRATIDGKVYWLDGTRLGDRSLDTIAVPGFKWALPLNDGSKTLAALVATEPAAPQTETRLQFDARAGLNKPATASGSITYRGDFGSAMRIGMTMLGTAKRDEAIRNMWSARYSWVDVKTATWSSDDSNGDVTFSFTGTAKLGWATGGLDAALRYQADNAQLGRDLAPDRDKEKDPNAAPVAVGADFSLSRETILLPDNGKGFTLEGDSFDRTIGGVHYVRTVSLKDGKFELVASSRNKPFELSYAEAKAADKQTDALSQKQLFILAPLAAGQPVVATTANPTAPGSKPIDTGLDEINRLSVAGRNRDALAAVDARIAGGDHSGRALAMRAQLLGRLDRKEEAGAAYDQALAVDRAEPTALLGKAQMLVDDGRLDDALILFDRLVLVWSDVPDVYRKRAAVRYDLGNTVGTLSDLGIAIDKDPDDRWARTTRVDLYIEQGKSADALADARALVARKPDDPDAYTLLAYVLAAQGKRTEAMAAGDKSIALKPTRYGYYMRLRMGLEPDDKARLSDVLALIALDPSAELPWQALQGLLADPVARTAITKAYGDAVAGDDSEDNDIALARDLMLAMAGDPKAYITRIDALLSKKPDDADTLNEACWARAMFHTDLEVATANCDKSIAKRRDAAVLDSRGLVWLQRGDWAKAAADFGGAVALRPRQPSSLYGRGIARKRMGDTAGAKADFDYAIRIQPDIAATYASYGLKP